VAELVDAQVSEACGH